MNKEREEILNIFLKENNLDDYDRKNIAGDASFRRYDRLTKEGETFILMDAPPPQEDVRPFINISEFLVLNNFSSPEIIAKDAENGFLVLEDLGDNRFTRILSGESSLESPPSEEEIYKAAIDVLLEMSKCQPPKNIPNYNEELLMKEVLLLTEWYIPLIYSGDNLEEAKNEYTEIWRGLISLSFLDEESLVYRDYHADNLMWLPEREGIKKVGLLDFQDAAVGSPAYDLVSLLEDARRDVDRDFAKEMLSYYLSKSTIGSEEFMQSYHILGAQRNCKIVGIFARLAIRDGKNEYPPLIPRVWGHIENDLQYPKLEKLKSWLDRNVSKEDRFKNSFQKESG